jgi:hypothetical protein
VPCAIDLNNDARLATGKVGNVAAYRLLADELESTELPVRNSTRSFDSAFVERRRNFLATGMLLLLAPRMPSS